MEKNHDKFIIGGIYRHPGHGIDAFSQELVIIDLCKGQTCSKANEYLSTVLLNNFFPAIIMPTRITPHTATVIDHIYYYEGRSVVRGNFEVRSGNFVSDVTDHLPNYLLLVNKKKINIKAQRPSVRIYSDKNKRNFIEDLSNTDWSIVYYQNNSNFAYDNLYRLY